MVCPIHAFRAPSEPAAPTIANTDIDQAAADTLARRRSEGRAVPAAPASAGDVPELDEAAKSRLLTPSGTSQSRTSQSSVKQLDDDGNTAKSIKRKRTKTIKKEAGNQLINQFNPFTQCPMHITLCAVVPLVPMFTAC